MQMLYTGVLNRWEQAGRIMDQLSQVDVSKDAAAINVEINILTKMEYCPKAS